MGLRKKRHSFIFMINYSDVIQFCQFLAETYLRKFETTTCTSYYMSFYVFVLYLVKTIASIFTPYSTASDMKSSHKCPVVASDNY